MFNRLLQLISLEDLKVIQKKRILLVGVGGVGGYALESLIRSGFQNITIIDGDVIDITNLNRQIIANTTNIGKLKSEVAKKRCLDINPGANIKAISVFLNQDNFQEYINKDYDYIIDACDDIKIKVLLIKYAQENEIKIISALGTGRRLDPTKLEIIKLNKTFNDPLAKKLRYELKKENISHNIPVVFSSEEAIKTEDTIGSAIFVPALAGILMANYIFNDAKEKN